MSCLTRKNTTICNSFQSSKPHFHLLFRSICCNLKMSSLLTRFPIYQSPRSSQINHLCQSAEKMTIKGSWLTSNATLCTRHSLLWQIVLQLVNLQERESCFQDPSTLMIKLSSFETKNGQEHTRRTKKIWVAGRSLGTNQ